VSPAKSKAQYRKARAMLARGEDGWARDVAEKTHSLKGLPERVKPKGGSKHGKSKKGR
jgi:hypothetical protein